MSNVVKIAPKSITRPYNDFTITATYNPDRKRWEYVAVKPVTTTIEFKGDAASLQRALAMAKRKVDDTNDKATRYRNDT